MLDDASFEAFLNKRRPHAPVFSMDGLDGCLTVLIIGPRFIDPHQWIPLFACERALMALEGTTEALAVLTLVANYKPDLERACRNAGNLAPALCTA